MQWVSNRNTLLCLLLLSWVINYCALVSFNPCPDEKRNVQPSFSPRLMFRLAPSFEGFVASLKNLQYNFPKMRGRGGVKGCLELFRKFIYFGRGRRPLCGSHRFLTMENMTKNYCKAGGTESRLRTETIKLLVFSLSDGMIWSGLVWWQR